MKNLKKLRKERNYTLQQLATELAISPQVLSRYEREERQADYSTLQKIAIFFNVSVDYLLGFSYNLGNITVKKDSYPDLTPEEEKLLSNYRTLPRQEKAQAFEYVNYLAERRGTQKKNA